MEFKYYLTFVNLLLTKLYYSNNLKLIELLKLREFGKKKQLNAELKPVKSCSAERDDLIFREMIDAASVGMMLITPKGKIFFVNERLCQMLGYECNELIGKNLEIILDSKEKINLSKLEKTDTFKKGKIFKRKKLFKRKDLSHFWGMLHFETLLNGKGEMSYIFVQVQDISIYKKRHQGESDGTGNAQARGPHDLGALLQGGIRSEQGSVGEQEDEGVVAQAHGDDHAGGPIDVGKRYAQILPEQKGEHALPAEEQDPGVGAYERRQDQRQRAQAEEESLEGHRGLGERVGHWHAQQAGEGHGEHSHGDRIAQRAAVEPGGSELGEVGQAEV